MKKIVLMVLVLIFVQMLFAQDALTSSRKLKKLGMKSQQIILLKQV